MLLLFVFVYMVTSLPTSFHRLALPKFDGSCEIWRGPPHPALQVVCTKGNRQDVCIEAWIIGNHAHIERVKGLGSLPLACPSFSQLLRGPGNLEDYFRVALVDRITLMDASFYRLFRDVNLGAKTIELNPPVRTSLYHAIIDNEARSYYTQLGFDIQDVCIFLLTLEKNERCLFRKAIESLRNYTFSQAIVDLTSLQENGVLYMANVLDTLERHNGSFQSVCQDLYRSRHEVDSARTLAQIFDILWYEGFRLGMFRDLSAFLSMKKKLEIWN